MKNIIVILILVIIVSCKEGKKVLTIAENNQTIITNKKTKKLDTLFNELYQDKSFNGNVLIAENGNIIYKKSFGLSNIKTNEKLNTETIFELASVSKQFTAMGIVQLVKQGKLSYSDKISKYIPELSKYKGITLRHLLTHTGGLPDYMNIADKNWDKLKIATNDDIIRLFAQLNPKIKFKPNEKWEYSNTGYLILATIIERVSGITFGNYLKETIFKPLNMKNTFVYRRRFQPKSVKNYAKGYIYSDSLKRMILPDELGKEFYVVYLDGIVGDGMVNSNLTDLFKWDRALYKDKIINNEDREMIFSSYKTNNGKETNYGFGWMIDSTKTYGKIANHSGGWAGYITHIERHLDNDKTIIILQNNSTEKIKVPVKNVRKILYDLPIEKPIELKDPTILKIFAGKYLKPNGKNREIVFENNKLYVVMNPEFKAELIPVSKVKFIVKEFSPEVTYKFTLNTKGKVEKYRVQQEATGLDKEAKKIE